MGQGQSEGRVFKSATVQQRPQCGFFGANADLFLELVGARCCGPVGAVFYMKQSRGSITPFHERRGFVA
jgi:hypothetical protein